MTLNGFEAIFNPKYITRLNSSGVVTSILAEQVGGKYDEFASGAGLPPPVTVDTPIGFSTGSFEFNETVTGQTSGVTGIVKSWDYDTRVLKVSIVSGSFTKGEMIVGAAATTKLVLLLLMTSMMILQKMML